MFREADHRQRTSNSRFPHPCARLWGTQHHGVAPDSRWPVIQNPSLQCCPHWMLRLAIQEARPPGDRAGHLRARAPCHTSFTPWSCAKLPRRCFNGDSSCGVGVLGGSSADGAVHSTTRVCPLQGGQASAPPMTQRPTAVSWPAGICWAPWTQHRSWPSAALALSGSRSRSASRGDHDDERMRVSLSAARPLCPRTHWVSPGAVAGRAG